MAVEALPQNGRAITERYALATLLALVAIICLTIGAILFLSGDPSAESAITAVVGLAGTSVGGLLIMLQNAQVRSALDRQSQMIQTEVTKQVGGGSDQIHKTLQEIKDQVVTLNEGTVGSFAAADETRRVEKIPHDERTPTEQRHVASAPPKEAPVGKR